MMFEIQKSETTLTCASSSETTLTISKLADILTFVASVHILYHNFEAVFNFLFLFR